MTSIYIQHCHLARKPAERISAALGCDYGQGSPSKPVDYIINYGSRYVDEDKAIKKIFNHPDVVANNTIHKGLSLARLNEGGVNTAKVYFPGSMEHEKFNWPLIGRPPTHFKGKGFHVCLNWEDVNRAIRLGASHFLEWIDVDTEWRVHVFGGIPIQINEKVREAFKAKGVQRYVRNHRNGFFFRLVNKIRDKLPDGLVHQAVQATYIAGMDFAAVDLAVSKSGQVYVLEINSAPGNGGVSSHTQNFADAVVYEIAQFEKR